MKPLPHRWGEAVKGDGRFWTKTCFTCGLQVRFILAGDAETGREVYADSVWKRTPRMPPCILVRTKVVKGKRVLTEAQKMAFQTPIRKNEP